MESTRERILGRIRTALGEATADPAASYAQIPRAYATSAALDREQVMHLFLDRLLDYDTEVLQVAGEGEIAGAIVQTLANANESHVLAPAEFPHAWLPDGPRFQIDDALTTEQIEAAQAVVTSCQAAVASTGTIILVHGGAQGRRVLTLLPDHHICIVKRSQVVATVPEAIAALGGAKPVTTISGPSATSDIEMTRIRGVHGPRRLTIVLYGA